MSITLNKFLKKSGYCSVKLIFLETKHYLIEAKVNGVSGKFILDTGASNSCICTSLEDKFKVISKESKEKASSATSQMTHTKISKSNTIQIGKWKDKINIITFAFLGIVFSVGYIFVKEPVMQIIKSIKL